MKLSEKYLEKLNADLEGEQGIVIEEIQTYGTICALEARKTLLVEYQTSFPQDKYISTLAEITTELQEIAEK